MSDDETNLPKTNSSETNDVAPDVAPVEAPREPEPSSVPSIPTPSKTVPPMPVVMVQSVTARDQAGPRGRARGTLNGISFSLTAGVFAFVGAPEDGTIALVDVLSGVRAPLRGHVQVVGVSPERSSRLRSRMGVLSPEPSLPSARSVTDLVTAALVARGQTQPRAADVLGSLGLDYLASRRPQSLSFAETRAVELALALSTPSPILVVLHEPLVDVAINLLGVVRERIQQLARDGACVVVTTSSPADARSVSDDIFLLHRGSVIRDVSIASAVAPNVPMLVAWVRPSDSSHGIAPIRRLAQALADKPEVSSVAWTDADVQPSRSAELRLSGSDLDACALALADAATDVGAVVEAITPASPGIARLRAAAETAESLRRAAAQSRLVGTNVPGRGGVR